MTTTLPSTQLDWALAYADGGALVLPLHTPTPAGCSCRHSCDKPGKHPRTLRGKDDAVNDLDTVERWWRMWPTANIGIRPLDGQIVLDVDPRNGGEVQLAAMLDRYGPLPATRMARTGSGGLHLWFTCPGRVRGALAPGIDIKSASGYLVVPPSVHASGGSYEWTNSGPIAAAPEFLRALLAPPPPPARRPGPVGPVTQAVVDALLRVVADAEDGQLNNRLYWACARAHEKGIDVAPLVEKAVEKGHPRRGAEATAESAAKAPPWDGGAA